MLTWNKAQEVSCHADHYHLSLRNPQVPGIPHKTKIPAGGVPVRMTWFHSSLVERRHLVEASDWY